METQRSGRSDRRKLASSRFLAPALIVVAAAGCNGMSWSWTPGIFSTPPTKTTFITPAQRIDELRTLADSRGGGASSDQVVAQLGEQLKSEADPLVREEVVRTLAAFPIASSVFVLEAALADVEPGVRVAACETLAKLRYAEALTALARAAKTDANVDVRLAALTALGNFQVQESIDSLAAALDDRDPAIQLAAMESLRRVTGQDFGGRADAWKMYARGETPPPPAPVSMAERLRGFSPF